MRVVLAPNTFRLSMTAREAVEAMAVGVTAVCPDAELIRQPMADGGDGTLAVLTEALKMDRRETEVRDPYGNPRPAHWAIHGEEAVIEMAEAGGLRHQGVGNRDLLGATTYGTGELIRAALDAGARRIYLGVGGSATIDGGIGALAALGVVFRDKAGSPLEPLPGKLDHLAEVDPSGLDPRLAERELIILADVTTAAIDCIARYGPQKGVRGDAIPVLERLFGHLDRCSGSFLEMRHGGAAGGIVAGLVSFAGARVVPGARTIARLTSLEDRIANADLVLTGEGRFDETSLEDKVPAVVCALAAEAQVPAVVLAGSYAAGVAEQGLPNAAVFSLTHEPTTLSEAIGDARRACREATTAVLRLFSAARGIGGG